MNDNWEKSALVMESNRALTLGCNRSALSVDYVPNVP